jgi:RNA polymerase sigma-70 factor (ECF subfamily)
MTIPSEHDTEELLQRLAHGDDEARGLLLRRYRSRLRQMIAICLDRRLRVRSDPSDVVQEALADADRKLVDYARQRPLPFYPWLRRLAWERLMQLHRRHLHAQRRRVRREEASGLPLPDESAELLANRLTSSSSSPSERLRHKERLATVQAALAQMAEADSEVLVLRYLEDLSTREIAAVLDLPIP